MTCFPLATEKLNIEREVDLGTDDYGQPIVQWKVIKKNIHCKKIPLFGFVASVRELIDENVLQSNATILIPFDTDITERDRIYHQDERTTWEVKAIINPGGFSHHKELTVQRIT